VVSNLGEIPFHGLPIASIAVRQGFHILTAVSGYFPNHEDPKSRIKRGHPFHLDSQKARKKSIALAAEECSPQDDKRPVLSRPAMSDIARLPVPSEEHSRVHTPVTSYMPTGTHDNPLPMGKYYPSNYENRNSPTPRSSSPSSAHPTAGTSKPELQVPRYRTETGAADSDAKRRLLQYQRDMIAQAMMATNQLLVKKPHPSGSLHPSLHPALSTRSVPTMNTHKPTSPRLAPLGSPGPVTPMDLEESDNEGGYLTKGKPLSAGGLPRELGSVLHAVRAEEGRRQKEGSTPPTADRRPVLSPTA
jgi:hypothetical protein